MAPRLPREPTLALLGVVPPEHIGPAALVDPADPFVQPLRKGDPTFGWEGDTRLALYLDVAGSAWELWRLEWDGVWRRCCTLEALSKAQPLGFRGPDAVAQMIGWLVAHDARRGFDPGRAVRAQVEQSEGEKDRARADWSEEAAMRLRHGLLKDGV